MTAEAVIEAAATRGVMLATAESCTGGMIAAALTDIAGSSAAFDRGFVTYSNAAKTAMLGVPSDLIDAHGAVSEHVARAMAEGALAHSDASLAVSVTGIAGPGGGSAAKPVGLVYIGISGPDGTQVREHRFDPKSSRADIRAATVGAALALLLAQLTGAAGP